MHGIRNNHKFLIVGILAIRSFEQEESHVQITPKFQYEGGMDSFLKNEADLLFTLKEHTKQLAGTIVHELFKSHIYLITDKDDPLAAKNIITDEDIYGRTLMVGGGHLSFIITHTAIIGVSGSQSCFDSFFLRFPSSPSFYEIRLFQPL